MSRMSTHPSRWRAGLNIWKVLSFHHFWGNLKFFFISFFEVFWIDKIMYIFDYIKMNSVLKMNFLLNYYPYPIPASISRIVICNTLVYQSSFNPYVITHLNFNNNKFTHFQTFKISLVRKLISHLNVWTNKRKYENPFEPKIYFMVRL